MKRLIEKLLETVSGSDNKLSSRKLTALVAMILYVGTTCVAINKITEAIYLILLVCVHPVFVSLIFGILTAQHIVDFKAGVSTHKSETDIQE